MKNIFYLLLAYFLYMMEYGMLSYPILGAITVKWKMIVWGIIAIIIMGIFSDNLGGEQEIALYVICSFVAFFSYYRSSSKETILFWIAFVLLLSFDECASLLINTVFHRDGFSLIEGGLLLVKCAICLVEISVLNFICHMKRRNSGVNAYVLPDRRIYFYLVILFVEILLVIAALNFTRSYVNNSIMVSFSIMLCTISYLSVGTLVYLVLCIRKSSQYLKTAYENEKEMYHRQKVYYEALLAREEDTKKFRHDLHNHIVCLSKYAEDGDNKKVKEYLSQFMSSLEEKRKGLFSTGNETIDILLSYYYGQIPPNADFIVMGKILFEYDEMEICTIVSNLIENSLEELKRLPSSQKKELRVILSQGTEKVKIEISNTSRRKNANHLHTEKDGKGHGYGIENVKTAVKKLEGSIFFESSDETFFVKVFLPISV